jgi:hypothetical protein
MVRRRSTVRFREGARPGGSPPSGRRSSGAEQAAHNRRVGGSSPPAATSLRAAAVGLRYPCPTLAPVPMSHVPAGRRALASCAGQSAPGGSSPEYARRNPTGQGVGIISRNIIGVEFCHALNDRCKRTVFLRSAPDGVLGMLGSASSSRCLRSASCSSIARLVITGSRSSEGVGFLG